MKESGQLIAANDPAGLTSLTEALQANPMAALQDAQFNPELQDDIRDIPACAPLNSN